MQDDFSQHTFKYKFFLTENQVRKLSFFVFHIHIVSTHELSASEYTVKP